MYSADVACELSLAPRDASCGFEGPDVGFKSRRVEVDCHPCANRSLGAEDHQQKLYRVISAPSDALLDRRL